MASSPDMTHRGMLVLCVCQRRFGGERGRSGPFDETGPHHVTPGCAACSLSRSWPALAVAAACVSFVTVQDPAVACAILADLKLAPDPDSPGSAPPASRRIRRSQ